MILTLMSNLSMFGQPKPPIPTTQGGGSDRDSILDHSEEWTKKILKDDEDLIILLGGWLVNKK